MRFLFCLPAVVACFLLAPRHGAAQDLPPRLAERFSEGVAALKGGELDAAERAFREVLAGGGARPFVHHNLGIVLQQRGRHANAVVEFRRAEKLDPAFGPAPLLAGTSLLALGRVGAATAQLERAVKLLPEEPAARLQLADAYERAGRISGMVEQYRWLAEHEPRNDEYAYRLGKAYVKLARWSYERLRAIDPNSARLPQALAEQYLDQGRPDLAQPALEEAARLDPSMPEIHLTLARIHLDAGRLGEASRAIDRELTIAPESAAARAVKARIDEASAAAKNER